MLNTQPLPPGPAKIVLPAGTDATDLGLITNLAHTMGAECGSEICIAPDEQTAVAVIDDHGTAVIPGSGNGSEGLTEAQVKACIAEALDQLPPPGNDTDTFVGLVVNPDGTATLTSADGSLQYTTELDTDTFGTLVQDSATQWTWTPANGGAPIVISDTTIADTDTFGTLVANPDGTHTWSPADGGADVVIPVPTIDTDTFVGIVVNPDGSATFTSADGSITYTTGADTDTFGSLVQDSPDQWTWTPADGGTPIVISDTDTTIPDTFGTLVANADGSFTWSPASGGADVVIPAPITSSEDGGPYTTTQSAPAVGDAGAVLIADDTSSEAATFQVSGSGLAVAAGTDTYGRDYEAGDVLLTDPQGNVICVPGKIDLAPITSDDGIFQAIQGTTSTVDVTQNDIAQDSAIDNWVIKTSPLPDGVVSASFDSVGMLSVEFASDAVPGEYRIDYCVDDAEDDPSNWSTVTFTVMETVLCCGVLEEVCTPVTDPDSGNQITTVTNTPASHVNDTVMDNGVGVSWGSENMTVYGSATGTIDFTQLVTATNPIGITFGNPQNVGVPTGAVAWPVDSGVNRDAFYEITQLPDNDTANCDTIYSIEFELRDIDVGIPTGSGNNSHFGPWSVTGGTLEIVNLTSLVEYDPATQTPTPGTGIWATPTGSGNANVRFKWSGFGVGDRFVSGIQQHRSEDLGMRLYDSCIQEPVDGTCDGSGNLLSAVDADGNPIADLSTVTLT